MRDLLNLIRSIKEPSRALEIDGIESIQDHQDERGTAYWWRKKQPIDLSNGVER